MLDSQKIKKIRLQRGLTQEQLAKKAGLKQFEVSKMESGRNKDIAGTSLVAVAAALGVEARVLIK